MPRGSENKPRGCKNMPRVNENMPRGAEDYIFDDKLAISLIPFLIKRG